MEMLVARLIANVRLKILLSYKNKIQIKEIFFIISSVLSAELRTGVWSSFSDKYNGIKDRTTTPAMTRKRNRAKHRITTGVHVVDSLKKDEDNKSK